MSSRTGKNGGRRDGQTSERRRAPPDVAREIEREAEVGDQESGAEQEQHAFQRHGPIVPGVIPVRGRGWDRSSGGSAPRTCPARRRSTRSLLATSRCVWLAGPPQTMQMASVLVMYSAMASSCGIGSNGLPEVVLVEAGDDHALAAAGELVAHRRQIRVEELALVDPDRPRCPARRATAGPSTSRHVVATGCACRCATRCGRRRSGCRCGA